DCRTCNRRRIKCDRATPSCRKCISRKLTCPGYGIILNWEWGVASRGKFARKSAPLLHPADTSYIQVDENRTSPISSPAHGEHEGNTINPPSSNQPGPLYFQINSVPDSVSAILQDSISCRLFHHYGQTIAASMAWIDGPDNAWRTIIMPLALQSPALLISVLAFAAEHLSALLPENAALRGTLAHRVGKYRDLALILVTSIMRSVTAMSESETMAMTGVKYDSHLVNSVLASMLVLCNMETVRPGSRLWRVHLDAARTVVGLRTNIPADKDKTFDFLVEQFFVADAFACTTSFVQTEDQDIMRDNSSSVFIEFLKLLRHVTLLERRATSQRPPKLDAEVSSSILCNMFERARDRTVMLSSNGPFATPVEREQFLSIINSFHHAGLLYSYRCLSYLGVEEEISKSRRELFRSLDFIQADHPAFAQNIIWPLFIAGTEALGIDGTQALVERKLQQAMRRTGFSGCEEALIFLRAFWTAKEGGQSNLSDIKYRDSQDEPYGQLNWIQCARYWTTHENQFLVF
ncbi:fungal-specific transcription factor domain-containing protein, partial [Xylogone sp. PMI_703]